MNSILLSYYLSNLKVELYMAYHNTVDSQWRDIDYTPDYSKFYFICDGEGWIKIGNQEYRPKIRQLVLMPEGVKQSYSTINDHLYTKYWCHFNACVGDINLFQLVELPHIWNVDDAVEVEELMKSIVTHANSGTVYGMLLAKSKLMELIAYCVMKLDSEQIVFKNGQAIEKLSAALDYIHQHIEKEFTIQELAAVARVHPNYFIRLFKRFMGAPPIQYITIRKIDKAKQLLGFTTHTVSEVAELVGFNDLFYFSKQFKKHTGLTPTEYRRQMSAGRT